MCELFCLGMLAGLVYLIVVVSAESRNQPPKQ